VLSDHSYVTNSSAHSWLISTILLECARSVLILARNLWTITLQSHHSSTYTHYGLLVILTALSIIVEAGVALVLWLWVSWTLIGKSSTHHVCLLMALRSHDDIVFFNYGDAVDSMRILLGALVWSFLTRCCIILLSLNHMTSKHLWVLDLNLRIVKDVIVIIYVFYYLDRLLLGLLFRLWWASASLMGTMKARVNVLNWETLAAIISLRLACMTIVAAQLVSHWLLWLSSLTISTAACPLWFRLFLALRLFLLVNYFTRIVQSVPFIIVRHLDIVRAAFTWLIEIELVLLLWLLELLALVQGVFIFRFARGLSFFVALTLVGESRIYLRLAWSRLWTCVTGCNWAWLWRAYCCLGFLKLAYFGTSKAALNVVLAPAAVNLNLIVEFNCVLDRNKPR